MTITEFLLARVAEDEEAAREGAGPPIYPHYGDTAAEECVEMAVSEGCSVYGAGHLGRWLPERVLAECAAKRAIVAEHPDYGGYGESCATCRDGDIDLKPWPCPTLRALADVYADHPDYDEAWRP